MRTALRAPSTRKSETRAQILESFLAIAVERGIDATSTKAVAAAAGVSELTLFRHFGDKPTLIREAIRHAAPVDQLDAFDLDFDVSTRESAAAGVTACLRLLRDATIESGGLLQFSLAEARRHPELATDLKAAPLAAQRLIDRALQRAEAHLQPGLPRRSAMLSLQGILLLTLTWTSLGWMRLSRTEWDALLADAVALVIAEPRAAPRRRNRTIASPPSRSARASLR